MTDNEKSITSQAISAVSTAVHALPPAFVVLALLNLAFIGALFWYLLTQQADRTTLLKQVLETCTVGPQAR
jgi:hypothetical protein